MLRILASLLLLIGLHAGAFSATYACDVVNKDQAVLAITTAEDSIILTVANSQQRYVQVTADVAWAISTTSGGAYTTKVQVPANTPYTILTSQSSQTFYIQGQTASGNLKVTTVATYQ